MSTLNPAAAAADWKRERRWLGLAGLLPFLVGAAALLLSNDSRVHADATGLLLHYAAVIASFLGAVHWGVTDQGGTRRWRLRWGVIPALLAWGLLALPAQAALVGFAALFAVILLVDRRLLPVLDDDYRRLRVPLTVTVALTLLVAALAVVPPPT